MSGATALICYNRRQNQERMRLQHSQNHRSFFLFAALFSACILASGAGFSAADVQKGFTPDEQKILMNFILQYDMGKAAQAGVEVLLRAHDDACAVTLVMDTYGVPRETAELFVRLAGQSNGIAATRRPRRRARRGSRHVISQDFRDDRRAISACALSRPERTSWTHSGGQTNAVTVKHASHAATACSSHAVPVSRSPSARSALPRLFCVIAQSSGTRSRVLSCSASRKALTASSSRAVPLSRSPSVQSASAEVALRRRPVERHALAGPFLQRGR